METATLLIYCPDRQGLSAILTQFIHKNGGNILHFDQHVDSQTNVFFTRVKWDMSGFNISRSELPVIFGEIAGELEMNWELSFSDIRPKLAIFVSREAHCLYDLLSRHEAGEIDADIPLIISNHDILKPVAERFGIPFHQFRITKDTKASQEEQEHALLQENNVDTVVLARYMQILSDNFVRKYPNRIINIHHSFLPAFPGAKPYHSAYERGVKLIGATSHYVTAELDQGPIIEQDVIRVTHRDAVEDLVRKGKDLEKVVLSRAVYHHVNHRVLAYNNKTVVFA